MILIIIGHIWSDKVLFFEFPHLLRLYILYYFCKNKIINNNFIYIIKNFVKLLYIIELNYYLF